MEEKQEILSLTGLRFVAAFYVFLFHIQIRWPIVDHWFAKNVLEHGALGIGHWALGIGHWALGIGHWA